MLVKARDDGWRETDDELQRRHDRELRDLAADESANHQGMRHGPEGALSDNHRVRLIGRAAFIDMRSLIMVNAGR